MLQAIVDGAKMIEFRCWYCNRRYKIGKDRIGEKILCSCKNPLRVPKHSGGHCRVRTPLDWALEITLYGFGGAIILFLAVLVIMRFVFYFLDVEAIGLCLAGSAIAGFLIGAFGGERAIDALGQWARDKTNG